MKEYNCGDVLSDSSAMLPELRLLIYLRADAEVDDRGIRFYFYEFHRNKVDWYYEKTLKYHTRIGNIPKPLLDLLIPEVL